MTSLFTECYPLASGRAHEVTGHGAALFAAIACGLRTREGRSTALWLVEDWRAEQLNPAGLAPYCDPGRLLMVRVPDHRSMQACAEEALRSGAVSVVVAEASRPLSFTAGRRLQLAAEAGGSTGILMIGDGMGNNAAESRWHCAPVSAAGRRFPAFFPTAFASGDSTLQRWQLIKNKSGTLGNWDIIWDAETRRVIVVSEAGERPGPAPSLAGDALCAHVAAE
ncbi:hypothetical protein [uncultured Cohaesibacter sp.]|uniref:ImuA family protein n=1 Tax=uncultured Cohaesibacter sp. TaxID=1002546 RepID=UPI0029C86816|nr:hypothetical protein [uncultured Cohaesibacter sp.]